MRMVKIRNYGHGIFRGHVVSLLCIAAAIAIAADSRAMAQAVAASAPLSYLGASRSGSPAISDGVLYFSGNSTYAYSLLGNVDAVKGELKPPAPSTLQPNFNLRESR